MKSDIEFSILIFEFDFFLLKMNEMRDFRYCQLRKCRLLRELLFEMLKSYSGIQKRKELKHFL